MISTDAGTSNICGLDYESADDFECDVKEAIVNAQGYYDAGTNLDTVNNDLQITWKWEFENATGEKNNQDNAKDTFLGDRAAQDEGNAGTIYVAATCNITQVD